MDDHPCTRSTWRVTAASLLAFLAPLVVYIITLAREITFVDGGELAAVAARLGIAHPPGYPLFTLLGRLFTLLPAGTVAFRVGLLSAVTTALAALLLYRSAVIIANCLVPRAHATARELAPLAGALLFAFALTPWSQAVVVEVYGLQACLLAAFLAATAAALSHPREAVRDWPLVAMTATAALTNHLSGSLLLLGVLPFAILSLVARGAGPARPALPLVRTAAAAIAPLLLYLYLPLRGAMNPAVAWDYPTSLHRFLVHVSARQYQGLLGSQGLRTGELQRFLGQQLPQEAGWVLPALAALGCAALLWKGRRFLVVTATPLAAYLLYNAAYPISDINLYYIPVIAILALWAAVGAAVLAHVLSAVPRAILRRAAPAPTAVVASAVAVAAGLLCLSPLRAHWRANDQHAFELVGRYTRDTLKYLDPDAVLFTSRWDTLSSPSMYYQHVMGIRPDVLVLDVRALSSAVLQRKLARRAPELEQACRAELEAVAEVARLAEQGRPYDVDDGRFRFARLRRKLVEQSLTQRPTYVSGDMLRHPMIAGLKLHPEGLVSRLATDEEFRSFPVPELEGPGVRGSDTRSKAEQELWFEYGVMMRNRARYLEDHGRQIEAQALLHLGQALSR